MGDKGEEPPRLRWHCLHSSPHHQSYRWQRAQPLARSGQRLVVTVRYAGEHLRAMLRRTFSLGPGPGSPGARASRQVGGTGLRPPLLLL
jgi:hypothetical protein